jgi:large subunit ribosomal protein L25
VLELNSRQALGRVKVPAEKLRFDDNSEERRAMERIELAATRRTVEKKTAKRLRREGRVPGILYGHGFESVPLHFDALDLKRTLATAGASQLIQLQIDEATPQPVLAREIQRDVLSGEPIHVDLLAVSMTEKITAEVTVTLIGEPESVATGEGLLLQGINTLEIECLPGDLIPHLEVDVSHLELNTAIYVEDLQVPQGITILSDPQELVAQVIYEEVEEEEEEEEELFVEEPAEVEVIGRGRAEEEGEEE